MLILPRNQVNDKMRLVNQRKETRNSEALQSPRWDAKLVAEHSLRWLQARGHGGHTAGGADADAAATAVSLKDAVGMLLHRMVLDGLFASSVCRTLDLWKAWADNGGMRKSDHAALLDAREAFAHASLLVAVIRDTTVAHEGTLSTDLQDCMSLWRTVRLG